MFKGYVPPTLALNACVTPNNGDYEDQKDKIFPSNC